MGLACAAPSWGCFCTSVGGSPAGTEGLDLLLTDLGDRYHVAVLSEAGRELVADPAFGRLPTPTRAEAEARHAAASARMPALFDAEAVAGKVEWEAPVWMRHARRCLACGACSFLCPTCHCFDIQDEVTAEGGVRFRCWDTCQFGEFTRMGAGHNPRPTQTERLRQRVSHKFKYLVEEFGRTGCTGCGRCVEACPVNIDIRSVLARDRGRRAMSDAGHLYVPNLAVIDRVVEETWDTKTFRAVFADAPMRERFAYHPGQFQEVSVFGVGEATFCLTSSPTRAGFIEFSAKKVGAVTSALHDLVPGETVGIRGPYGNWFPARGASRKEPALRGGRDRHGAVALALELLPRPTIRLWPHRYLLRGANPG